LEKNKKRRKERKESRRLGEKRNKEKCFAETQA
jgi:hypothetical protein